MKYWTQKPDFTKALPLAGLRRALQSCIDALSVCTRAGAAIDSQGALRYAKAAARAARALLIASFNNQCLARKQTLLFDPHACRKLIKTLGGESRLTRWDAAKARSQERWAAHKAPAAQWPIMAASATRKPQTQRLASFDLFARFHAISYPEEAAFLGASAAPPAPHFRLPPLRRLAAQRRAAAPIRSDFIAGGRITPLDSLGVLPPIIVSPLELRRGAAYRARSRRTISPPRLNCPAVQSRAKPAPDKSTPKKSAPKKSASDTRRIRDGP